MGRDADESGNVPRDGTGKPTMTRTRKLTDLISMRLTPEDSEELDAVCEQMPIPRLTVARIALRLGLAELRKNPARVLEGKTKRRPKRGAKRWVVRPK
jgi:hypothetical protein